MKGSPPLGADKAVWRRWATETRSSLDHATLNKTVCGHLAAWSDFQRVQHILVYLAFGSEIDLAALRENADKRFYSTRTHRNGSLSVHLLEGALERHPYGFWQPAAGLAEVEPERIELALVPGLVFDTHGNRLGYGKGFYDRLLPRLRADALRVGVTVSGLIVETLPSEAHDVPMTHLADETGVRRL